MRKIGYVLLVLLLSGMSFAGTTAVTATITDSDTQTWNNGTFSVTFVPLPGTRASDYNVAGVAFTQQFSGTMNGSGVLSVTLTDLSTVSPVGGQWRFTLCPNASSGCSQVLSAGVIGASVDLSASLSAGTSPPRFSAGLFAFGYRNGEVNTNNLVPGSTYFNVTNGGPSFWNGSAWVASSSTPGTVTNTGGALTANAVVLGAGGADTKVSTGFTTDGAANLSLGSTGVGGTLTIFGTTSGSGTVTAVGNGTGINFSAASMTIGASGSLNNTSGNLTINGTSQLVLNPGTKIQLGGTGVTTTTNCAAVGTAANPSVASCTGAYAGSFSCATAASTGTCQVNTTAVTANSEIYITQRTDTTTGTRLSVTCNTTVSTVIPVITAVTAGTSFTINLGTITTNPECFSYWIMN